MFRRTESTVILFGSYNMSGYLNTSDVEAKQDNPITTTYGATGVRRQLAGLKDASMTFGGLHEAAAGGSHPVFTAALGAAAAIVVTRGVEGLAGAPVSAHGRPRKLLQHRRAGRRGCPSDRRDQGDGGSTTASRSTTSPRRRSPRQAVVTDNAPLSTNGA